MSLFLHRRAIARAVSGDLAEAAEQRLRAHLRGCDACRAHYDDLARAAEAFAETRAESGPDVPARAATVASARERARLLAALSADAGQAVAGSSSSSSSSSERPAARAPRPAWIATLLVPATLAAWFFLRPAPRVSSPGAVDAATVAWRGGPSADELQPEPPAALLIFAARNDRKPTEHVRLVADLPGSGEGRVSAQHDFVQFVLRGLTRRSYVMVVGVDDAGQVHTFVPRSGAGARAYEPSAGAISLGASIKLPGAGPRGGNLRLYALLSPEPIDEARVRAAAGRLDRSRPGAPALDLPLPQVAGVLVMEP